MNTQSLQAFAGRWPHDDINSDPENIPTIADVMRAVTEPAAYFRDTLRVDQADAQAMGAFAAANSMQYQTYGAAPSGYPLTHPPAWMGILNAATTPNLIHEVKGTILGYPVSFCLEYSPQRSQNDRSTDRPANGFGLRFTTNTTTVSQTSLDKRSIIRVTLPKVFPQMVLDSNKNDRGHTSSIPTTIEPDQLLTLEGSFQNYFDFYAPTGVQVNTLTVLSPNFMQILMDGASTFDVELYGNELILVTRECIYDPAVMTQALQALEAQLTYLDRLLASWNYLPLTPPFDLLKYPFVNGSVTKIGKFRIRPLTMLIIILVGFVVYGVIIVIA
jgi:hypothetical protein